MERTLRQRVDVSPEMVALVGAGAISTAGWPSDPLVLTFDTMGATFSNIRPAEVDAAEDAALVLVVSAAACRRIFGVAPPEPGCWHMPSELRAIALAICECDAPESARPTLRLAKSIELLCAAFAAFAAGTLTAADPDGELTELDGARVAAARRLIDDRWHEKLTLDGIARTVGLNRAKLTRGFRLMYATSIATALAENRLTGARRLLLATDLPVSVVGYRCAYLSNASFTRAFHRRFGVAPTQLRQTGIAA